MRIIHLFCLACAFALSACSSGAPGEAPATAAPLTPPTADVRPTTDDRSPVEPTAAPTATSTPVAAPTAAPTATPTVAPEPTTASVTGACANRYLPVAQGASWQYRISGVSSGTFTRVIAALRPDGFDDEDTFDAGLTRASSWACQNGDLIALTPSGGTSVVTADLQFDFTVESNEGVTLPADPQPGQTWTQKVVYSGQQTVGDLTLQSRNVAETSCKAAGVETVSVPAGAFEALRVDCETTIQINLTGAPAGLPALTFESAEARWFAPGVGLIKSSGTTSMGATETVLLSYNPPP